MIFATLVRYFFEIPSIDAVTVIGIPISGKVLNYSIALQVFHYFFILLGINTLNLRTLTLLIFADAFGQQGVSSSRGLWNGKIGSHSLAIVPITVPCAI